MQVFVHRNRTAIYSFCKKIFYRILLYRNNKTRNVMKQRVFLSLALLAATPLVAQNAKEWTLQDCIDHALDQNIQLQQDRLQLQSSETDVKTAKAALFPTLTLSTSHNLMNRPFQTQSNTVSGTEIITSNNKNTYNGNYGLNAQWTVWNGGRRRNNIETQKTNYKIAGLTVRQTENTLQEEITKLYMQILYAHEAVAINQGTLQVSRATCQCAQELFSEGSISKADLAQLEAQVSNDEYQTVTAESTLRNYKLQLKQLLELDGTAELALRLPELTDETVLQLLPAQADVYAAALAQRPEIQSGKLSIDNARLALQTAKAGYLPTISLTASSSSTTNSASSNSWSQQMKYGWNNMIGLSLSLPLFDGRTNKSNVEKARLQYDSSRYDLMSKQKELYATIESLWLDALNAQQQYSAASTNVKSCQTSYDMVSEQFNLGMKNTVELLTEKNNLLSAQQQRLQAKYMVLLNRALLDFYAGNNIDI